MYLTDGWSFVESLHVPSRQLASWLPGVGSMGYRLFLTLFFSNPLVGWSHQYSWKRILVMAGALIGAGMVLSHLHVGLGHQGF